MDATARIFIAGVNHSVEDKGIMTCVLITVTCVLITITCSYHFNKYPYHYNMCSYHPSLCHALLFKLSLKKIMPIKLLPLWSTYTSPNTHGMLQTQEIFDKCWRVLGVKYRYVPVTTIQGMFKLRWKICVLCVATNFFFNLQTGILRNCFLLLIIFSYSLFL